MSELDHGTNESNPFAGPPPVQAWNGRLAKIFGRQVFASRVVTV